MVAAAVAKGQTVQGRRHGLRPPSAGARRHPGPDRGPRRLLRDRLRPGRLHLLPASISVDTGPRDAATAGYVYYQGVHAFAGTLLGASHAVVVVQAPSGAVADARGVTWLPQAGAAGSTEPFHPRSDTDVCGDAADLAWTVRVHPAPAIVSFTATPPEASIAGTPVTLRAEYTDGDGALVGPFVAPFPSGTSLDAGTISSTTTFVLRVTSPAGDALDQALTVVAR